MKIALDTNRYTDLARSDPAALQIVSAAQEVGIPVIVLGELRAGFRRGARQADNEDALQKFLTRPGVRVLLIDEQTSFAYAILEADLRNRGKAIPTNDVWIAALTMQHGLQLYTRDQHFSHLPQLPRV